MKLLRAVLGGIFLVFGLYVLVGEYFAGTSADATVNARINVIRTPVNGEVQLAVRTIGGRVTPGQLVAEVVDARFDTARLLDLERERETARIEVERLAAQREVLSKARTGFQAQLALYQKGRVSQIQARSAEAAAAEDAARARERAAAGVLERATNLNKRGVQTVAGLESAQASYDVAQQDLESARQRRNYYATELAAAETGVFLGDSNSDAPSSSQRVRELDLQTAELDTAKAEASARIAQLDAQIRSERVRVNTLTSATLNATVEGIVWDLAVDDGEYASRGQTLVRLADCRTLMVTASVHESLYDSLSIGAPVQFRLFGDHRVFDGTIVRLGGSGAESLYSNLAVAPSAEHLERFDVTVSVPALAGEADLSCAIGRTGRVIFSNGPIATARRFLTRYGL